MTFTHLLYQAVKKAAVSSSDVVPGDLVVITEDERDVVGIVQKASGSSLTLKTSQGSQIFEISNENFIHIIKTADMLDLRNHTDYERDLKDVEAEDYQNDGRPVFSPVEDSEKSELPTSKISLSLKKRKKSE